MDSPSPPFQASQPLTVAPRVTKGFQVRGVVTGEMHDHGLAVAGDGNPVRHHRGKGPEHQVDEHAERGIMVLARRQFLRSEETAVPDLDIQRPV